MKVEITKPIMRKFSPDIWLDAGTYQVIRKFDETRYLIRIHEGQITLVNQKDCQVL